MRWQISGIYFTISTVPPRLNSSFLLYAHCIDFKIEFTFQLAISQYFDVIKLADQAVYV
jgi:hypothetical protein